MEKKKQRINWHNAFGRILKHRWTPLGLKVIPEFIVSKDPQRIDVIVTQQESPLTTDLLEQLPDGIRENLKEHNLIDFKSTHETYGRNQLETTCKYAIHYREEENISSEQLAIFAVSSMIPKKLLKEISDWVQIEGAGIYKIDLNLWKVILLVPNEMESKEANDVFQLFSSQKEYALRSLQRMIEAPFWYALEGIFTIFNHLIQELMMSGLTMEQLAKYDLPIVLSSASTEEVADAIVSLENNDKLLQDIIDRLSDEKFEKLLEARKQK